MPYIINPYRFGVVSRDWIPTDSSNGGGSDWCWHNAGDTGNIDDTANAVNQLDDSSGNGWHLKQTTAADKPTTNSVVLDSKNGIYFDGTTEHLKTDSDFTAIGTNDMTLMFVGRVYATSTTNMVMMAASDDITGITRGTGWKYTQRTNDDIRFVITDDITTSDNVLLENVFDSTRAYLFGVTIERTGSTSLSEKRYVDGDLLQTNAKSGAQFDTLNLTGPLCWAAAHNGTGAGLYYKIDLFEGIYIIGDLDSTYRVKAEGYLAHRWGLESYLPVGHTYKSAAPQYPADA